MPDTDGDGGRRGKGRREEGAGNSDTSFCKMLLGPNFICRIFLALRSLESSVLPLLPFLFQEEPPAQDGIQTQCTSG